MFQSLELIKVYYLHSVNTHVIQGEVIRSIFTYLWATRSEYDFEFLVVNHKERQKPADESNTSFEGKIACHESSQRSTEVCLFAVDLSTF